MKPGQRNCLPRLPEGVYIPFKTPWPVILRAGRLSLAPLRREHLRQWYQVRWDNRYWTGPWDASRPSQSPRLDDSYLGWLRRLNKQAKAGESLPWALWWDDELIGQVSVSSISYGSAQNASIGYWIAQSYAGRGLTPIAVALASDYLWRSLLLHRVEIPIRPENQPSLRVVEKLGFRDEGLRPRFLHIAGDWRDHRIFALNDEEVPGGLVPRYFAGRNAAEMGLL